MRTTQTVILRLLIDSDDPGALRGALRPVGDPVERPFADEQSLVALMRQSAGWSHRAAGRPAGAAALTDTGNSRPDPAGDSRSGPRE